MEEEARRESSNFCSTSGTARRLRDVHPGDLFLKTSKNLLRQGFEFNQTNHLRGFAKFPKKRRAAGTSAPATMGKVSEGPQLPAKTTAACCTPTSILCHIKDLWPDSSADSPHLPEGQLITGVHPTRGLFSGTVQAQPTYLPVASAADLHPCRSSLPARLAEVGAISQPTSKPARYSVPAASATLCCPHSHRARREILAGSSSCPGVSSASSSTAGWQRSQPPVWPQQSASYGARVSVARAPPQNSASRPLHIEGTAAMSEGEESYIPARGQPLRLCLADWGLPFAITQVRSLLSSPHMVSLYVQTPFRPLIVLEA